MTFAIFAAALISEAAPQLPAWMAGCWQQPAEERWVEECWSSPRGGMMIGYSRSGTGERIDEWEMMQIVVGEPAGHAIVKMAFWASPGGANRTMFAWSPTDEPGVTFYNVANDYPQRIRYWRQGDDLLAEISLKDGSKPQRWRYSRKRD